MATEHTVPEEKPRPDDRTIDDETASASGDEPSSRTDDPYVVRPYRPDDRDGFLELYDLVLGERDDEWFHWKYEANPYIDHVPMIVATYESQVVGAKPCFALELSVGSTTKLGLQPADVMVHPDHRRNGLYSRTTERVKDHYRNRKPALFFNFPNEATLSGSLKHGWRTVQEVPTFYRVQQPESMVDDDHRLAALSSLARPLAYGYRTACDRLADPPTDVTVHRFDDVPIEQFVELSDRETPGTIHANRDETFYGWRFDNPRWSYDAYLASRGGRPIAGVVVGTSVDDGSRITCLTDVVPLDETTDRRDGLRAIVDRVVENHRDAALLAASGRAIPSSLLRRFGFRSDRRLPHSRVTLPTTQVTYPIEDDGGHEWTVGGRAVTDRSNWTITFAEQDSW
ncbi:GNAT family N-acetyltransferase [Natrarchaeobius chitinivorans]|uniref:GNAT family N-acetyltransferase n=1 Tax=Natrarchaeobius chitinivorans TaxID=1679083 RepID=A0A3N6MR47_NATCH|nr:GNAT family N-acetyltransferase [Natrarchaeobius chitinivorans]RQG97116.1 GNAT family N-acetyltransferase [Natrarchaeobius chitinivorans]